MPETSRIDFEYVGFDEVPEELLPAPDSSSPAFPHGQEECTSLLRRASRACSIAQRRLLSLRYHDEMTYAEIAVIFRVSEPSVFEMHRRAIAQLAATLAEMGVARLDQIL